VIQFINPLLLWGTLAASVPVIIHLLHRRRYHRQRWAAMEWLLQAAKRTRRRLRMENLLLLLVRTLAVLLLALALARPTFSDSPIALGPTRTTHLYVLLDTSASMGARVGTRTVLDEALSSVSSLVATLGDSDPVTIVVTNDDWGEGRRTGRPRRILNATTDRAAIRRRLGELRPANARADLADALKVLEESVPSTGGAERRVVLVTDLQEVTFSGRRESDADPIRPLLARLREKGAETVLVPVGRDVANVAVTNVRPVEERDVVQGATAVFQAEVRNYSDRPQKVEVRFLVDGEERGEGSSQWIQVPPRSAGPDAPPAATAQFWTTFAEKDVGVHTVEARIAADSLAADDARSYAFQVRPRIRVLAVDGDPAPPEAGKTPETFFLVPALAIREDGPIAVRAVTEGEFHQLRNLDDWDLVVLANVERPAPDEDARKRLEEYVRKGGGLLLTVGDRVVPSRWNDELYRRAEGLLPARLLEARVDPATVLRFDMSQNRHPILLDLTSPANAVFFGSPLLTGRMALDGLEGEKEARVALNYDDLAHSPALVEKRFGRGRVLLLTTTIDEAWGKLPGSYLFPALLHETVYHMTSRGDADRNLLAFQTYVRSVPEDLASFEVAAPDGTQVRIDREAGTDAPTVSFADTSLLGVYRTTLQRKPSDLLGRAPAPVREAFAVNLTPLESDLRRAPAEVLLARWQGLLRTAGESGAAAATARAKAGEIAGPLLAAALACLLVEVLLVQRIGGRRRT
jgi:hypothetical protein